MRILTVSMSFAVAACFVCSGLNAQQRTRPSAEDLFPENTVLFLQIQDLRDLAMDFNNSNGGQLLKNEKIAPLVDELWGQAKEAYSQVEEQVGLSLADIQSLPTGEICFAAIAPKREDMQFALIMDVDPESESTKKIEARGRSAVEEQGGTIEDEETADIKFTTVAGPENDTRFTYFQKDGTYVITNSRELSQQILDRWLGREVAKIRSLRENRKFITIMNRCRGTKETPPEMRAFMDPIEFIRSASRGNVGTQAALNFLPMLGLDGLLGVGGSVIFGEMEFESVTHAHVMMANPRAGILEMIALKPGDYRPQSWISEETGNYMSTSWNLPKMYTELGKIVDLFQSEGFFEEQIKTNINDRLDIDLKEDILGCLTGRISLAQWVEPPARINSQVNGFGIELTDVKQAEDLIVHLLGRINTDADEPRVIEAEHKGVKYWTTPTNDGQRDRIEALRESGELAVNVRLPEPGFAIIDQTLVISDSVAFIKHAIETSKGNHPPLSENTEFVNITRKMTNLLGTDMPAALMYSQPGPTMESMLNVARGDDVKSFLDQQGEGNSYIKNFKRALDDHPLPEWDEIKGFFRPSGGFITSDDSGYHALLFQLKAEQK